MSKFSKAKISIFVIISQHLNIQPRLKAYRISDTKHKCPLSRSNYLAEQIDLQRCLPKAVTHAQKAARRNISQFRQCSVRHLVLIHIVCFNLRSRFPASLAAKLLKVTLNVTYHSLLAYLQIQGGQTSSHSHASSSA